MNRVFAIILFALVVLSTGCGTVTDSATDTRTNGGIITIVGEIETDSGEFRLDGEVMNSQRGEPPAHRNTKIHLFTENGTLIQTVDVGTLERRTSVSVETDTVPTYVIINSPDFWKYSEIDVAYFKLVDGTYSEYGVAERDDFPVELPE